MKDEKEEYEMIKQTIEEAMNKRFENVVVPDGIFDFDEVFRKGDIIKRRRKIIKYTTRIAAVLIIAIVATLVIVNNVNKSNEVKKFAENTEENNQVTGYVKEIFVENKNVYYDELNNKDYVYSIKLNKIIKYSVYKKDGVTYPITQVEAEVLNSFTENKMDDITFWIPGGIWTVAELKASEFAYDKNELIDLKEKDSICVKYYEKYKHAKPEEGKTYLITLKIENNEFYVETNAKYGFKEYDVETSSILNDCNEWKVVEMEKYLEE